MHSGLAAMLRGAESVNVSQKPEHLKLDRFECQSFCALNPKPKSQQQEHLKEPVLEARGVLGGFTPEDFQWFA